MHRPYLIVALFLTLVTSVVTTKIAHAGGLEYPDNGAEAMGRGAAFTAKADDGTALMYNVAGFARQRGWRLTLGSNTAFHSATFQRAGVYPDDPKDPLTPWGGQKFPLVKSTGTPIPIPHLVLSTDLGTDRLTVGMGIYAPSVLGGRVFPLGIDGKPSPARYDAIKGGGIIAYPSLFAAYRVTDWLDLGLAANFVIASIEATSMSSADLAKALCPNQEYQPCDARQSVKATGGAALFSIGAMLRPTPSVAIGLQFRTPHKLETEGTVTAQSPSVQPAPIAPGQAFLTQPFPWVLRGGVRYVSMDATTKREAWDAEADVTYEAWGSALADGTQVYIPKLSLFEDIHSTIKLGFEDTMSFRAGGAYNIPLGGDGGATPAGVKEEGRSADVISLRGGGFHDTAATKPENTRLIFDTLAKTGITAGIGFKHGPVMVNLAVAKIFHASREVTNGNVRPINGSQAGKTVDGAGAPYAPVNNGTYTASTFVVALGVTIQIEELFGSKRIPTYGADYEVTTRPPTNPSENERAPPLEAPPKPDDEERESKKNRSSPPPPPADTAASLETEVVTVADDAPSPPSKKQDKKKLTTKRPKKPRAAPKAPPSTIRTSATR